MCYGKIKTYSNNYAELNASRFFLVVATEQKVMSILIFEYSKLVVKWMKGTGVFLSSNLIFLGDDVKAIARGFNSISFQHVYTEQNTEVDRLSREGHQVAEGRALYEDIRDGISSLS